MQVKLRSALNSQNILFYTNVRHFIYENFWFQIDPQVSIATVTNKYQKWQLAWRKLSGSMDRKWVY